MDISALANRLIGPLQRGSNGLVILIAVVLLVSILAGAWLMARVASRRRAGRSSAEIGGRRSLRDSVRLIAGPFPLSVALHVAALIILVSVIHQTHATRYFLVQLENGGGGGSSHVDTTTPQLPDVSAPDTRAEDMVRLPVIPVARTRTLATDYVRAVTRGSFSHEGGGGVGLGYGHAVGNSFGGYISFLRHRGLDVVLVIDGTGSMEDVIGDVKSRMDQLVLAIHRLVPTARIGAVVFGGVGDPIEIQPFTLSSQKLAAFIGMIPGKGGGEWRENTLGAIQTAVDKMGWQASAKKVIVLVGDTPPFDKNVGEVMQLIREFHAEGGTFNTVDVTVEEHQRYYRRWYYGIYGVYPKKITPLQHFYLETQHAYQLMAHEGGGEWHSLTTEMAINRQVLILAFGKRWQSEVAAFGANITADNH